MTQSNRTDQISRRQTLRLIGAAGLSWPLSNLLPGCAANTGPSENVLAALRLQPHSKAGSEYLVMFGPEKNIPDPARVVNEVTEFRDIGDDSKPTRVIHAVEYTLNENTFSPEVDLVVFADVIHIEGKRLSAPGRSVFLHARRIQAAGTSETETTLDVSGAPGAEPSARRADDGNDNNRDGKRGDNGSVGGSGGTIHLVAGIIDGALTLVANGGKGGDGQAGGYGNSGARGHEGWPNRDRNGGEGQPGGRGGSGGTAGRGGAGGPGGNGGTLIIERVVLEYPGEPSTSRVVVLTPKGGDGARPGRDGEPGPGGPGGDGGIGYETVEGGGTETTPERYSRVPTHRAATGPQGRIGDKWPPQTSAPVGENGSVTNRTITSEEFGSIASLRQAKLVLDFACTRYVNGAYLEAAQLLNWLSEVTTASPARELARPLKCLAIRREHLLGERVDFADILGASGDWQVVRNRVLALLSQMATGLDYFGHSYNWVPVLDHNYYNQLCESMLANAEVIQIARDNYQQHEDDQELQRREIVTSIERSEQILVSMSAAIKHSETEADALQDQILALNAEAEARFKAIQESNVAFQDAVRNATGGCSLLDALAVVGSIASLAAGQYDSMKKLLSGTGLGSSREGGPNIVADIKQIGGSLQNIREQYAAMRKQIVAFDNRVKIVLPSEEFAKRIDEFRRQMEKYKSHSDEDVRARAEKYEQTLLEYVDVCDKRSKTALAYSSIVCKVNSMRASIVVARSEISRLNDQRVTEFDPGLKVFSSFMGYADARARESVVALMYEFERSISFWQVVAPQMVPVVQSRVDSIRAAWTELKMREHTARVTRGGPASELATPATIEISEARYSEALAGIRSRGEATLVTHSGMNEFTLGHSSLRVRSIAMTIEGVRAGLRHLYISLQHGGISTIMDRDRRLHEFSHQPRTYGLIAQPMSGMFSYVGETQFTFDSPEDRSYAYLSPLAAWRIRISVSDNPGLLLDDVRSIRKLIIRFYLSGFPL